MHNSHHHHHHHTTTTTTSRRGGLFSHRVQHQKRHATLGDKISGAFLKLKGTLTGRPGEKVRRTPPSSFFLPLSPAGPIMLTRRPQAAGTRRMHGTDGRGSHRRRRFF